MPTSPAALPRPGDPLRIALLVYRGNPHCGGQGVYSRYLARELTELGHEVTMFAGQPWPDADEPVTLEKVPGLDLYRRENPFRVPWPYEFRTLDRPPGVRDHVRGGVPRAVRVQPPRLERLRDRRGRLRPRPRQPVPRHRAARLDATTAGRSLDTLHHPITVDRDLDLAHADDAVAPRSRCAAGTASSACR